MAKLTSFGKVKRNGKLYYLLYDEFGTHHYVPRDDVKRALREGCDIKGIRLNRAGSIIQTKY